MIATLLSRLRRPDVTARFARGAGVSFVIQIIGVATRYFSQVLLARWMASAEYGAYTFAVSCAQLLAVVGGLGLAPMSLRFVAQYLINRDWGYLNGLINRSRQMVWIVGIAIALVGSGVVLVIPPQKIPTPVLLTGLWLIPLLALLTLQSDVTRGAQHIGLALLPSGVLQLAVTCGLAWLALILTGALTSVMALGAFGLSTIVMLGLQEWGLNRVLPAEVAQAKPQYETGVWLRVSFPMLVMALTSLMIAQVDLIMVGIMLGPEAAAVYSAAVRTAILVSMVLVVVNTVAAPTIASLHARHDQDGLQQVVSFASHWIFWPALTLTIGLMLGGKFVLGLFGPEFMSGELALRLLVLGQLVNSATGTVAYLLLYTGNENLGAQVYFSCALLSVGLNAFLIPLWGIKGAATANMIVMMVLNIWLAILVKKRLGIQTVLFLDILERYTKCP